MLSITLKTARGGAVWKCLKKTGKMINEMDDDDDLSFSLSPSSASKVVPIFGRDKRRYACEGRAERGGGFHIDRWVPIRGNGFVSSGRGPTGGIESMGGSRTTGSRSWTKKDLLTNSVGPCRVIPADGGLSHGLSDFENLFP